MHHHRSLLSFVTVFDPIPLLDEEFDVFDIAADQPRDRSDDESWDDELMEMT